MNSSKKMCQIAPYLCAKGISFIPIFLSLLVALAPPLPASAGPPPIDELMAKIQESYQKTEDIRALFVQEVAVKSLKKTDREEGIFYFKKPRMMRWDYTLPKPKMLIVNEKELWLYVVEDGVAYVQDAKESLKSRTIIRFLSGLGKISDDFHVQYADPSPSAMGDNIFLTLTPKRKEPGIEKLRLTIDRSDLHIKECRFADLFGNTTRIAFVNVEINGGLSSKLFTFTPPAGVEIVRMPK